MKTIAILTSIILLFSLSICAQTEAENSENAPDTQKAEKAEPNSTEKIIMEGPDTTRLRIGSKKIIIIDENNDITIEGDTTGFDFEYDSEDKTNDFDGHWGGLDIGMNNYLNSNYTMTLPNNADFMELNTGQSWGISINPIEQNFNIYNEQIGLVTGLGFEFNNYKFDNNIVLVDDPAGVTYFLDTVRQFSKNKLTTIYLNIPLILEAQIPVGDDEIHIGAGIIGGVKIGSHTKYIYENNGNKMKNKQFEDFNLNSFRYGVTARVGYKGINLFANMNLSSMFEDNKGPELFPVMIGFSVVGL